MPETSLLQIVSASTVLVLNKLQAPFTASSLIFSLLLLVELFVTVLYMLCHSYIQD